MNTFKRTKDGLVEGVEYQHKENGTVDWEKMINPKYIVLFKDKQADIEKKYKKSFYQLQKEMQNGETEVDNKFKLVLLAGWRELAQLRGFKSSKISHFVSQDNYVSIGWEITWMGNYETGMEEVTHSDAGDAHFHNTYDFTRNYLSAMAANRAFSRAVRSFLNIDILAADEISDKAPREITEDSDNNVSKETKETAPATGPHVTLEKQVKKLLKLNNFDEFKAFLKDNYKSKDRILSKTEAPKWAEYEKYEDINKSDCFKLIKKVREYASKN